MRYPLLETWYQELLDDANATENDAERAEAIAALGTPEAFIANLKSQYVTPIITGIQRGREALETRTANRLANEALGAIRQAASDANVTEAEIAELWTVALPLIEAWYQELLDDANAIENDAERTEAIAALGTPEQFVANLKVPICYACSDKHTEQSRGVRNADSQQTGTNGTKRYPGSRKRCEHHRGRDQPIVDRCPASH